MQAILIILLLVLSNMVGRWALRSMGVIMIGSLAGLIIKPTIYGFFILLFGLAVLALLFKLLFYAAPIFIIIILLAIIFRRR